jgi:hypothetical protein
MTWNQGVGVRHHISSHNLIEGIMHIKMAEFRRHVSSFRVSHRSACALVVLFIIQ